MNYFDALICKTHCRKFDGEFFVLSVPAPTKIGAALSATAAVIEMQKEDSDYIYSVLKVGLGGSLDSKVGCFERMSDG